MEGKIEFTVEKMSNKDAYTAMIKKRGITAYGETEKEAMLKMLEMLSDEIKAMPSFQDLAE